MTPRAWSIAPPAAVLVLTLLAFLPALSNGFVNWDDPENLLDNWSYRGLGLDQIRWMFTTFHMGHYQPLAWLTLGADYAIWGMNPFGYHLTSLLFHLANALLFYFVSLRLLALADGAGRAAALGTTAPPATAPASSAARPARDLRLAAALSAGLFSVHPLRVESVAWATERRDVVCGMFVLVSVLAYLHANGGRQARAARWRSASVVAFGLALLAKAIATPLPVLLLVLDVYPLRRLEDRGSGRLRAALSLVAEKVPYLALSLGSAFLAYRAQKATQYVPGLEDVDLLERLALVLYGIAFYVGKTFLPVGLSAAHVHPDLGPTSAPFLSSAAIVVAITVLAVRLGRRSPALPAVWVAYVVALLPVLGIVQVFVYAAAERYSYLSCLGYPLLAAGVLLAAIGRARVPRAALSVAAALVLLALSLATARQARFWRDSETLWRRALDVDPSNHIALYNLGVEWTRQARLEEAEGVFVRAVQNEPGFSDALAGLGGLALRMGKEDEAIGYLRRALDAGPGNPVALSNMGMVLRGRGDRESAVALFREAARVKPEYLDAWRNLGATLAEVGRPAEAAEAFARAVAIDPGERGLRRSLAAALLRAGERRAAVDRLRETLARDPSDFESANMLAWTLATAPEAALRDGREAVRLARAALEAAAGAADVGAAEPAAHLLDTHAAALAEAGEFEKAASVARRALARAEASGDSAQAREIQERLALYERREAFRER